MWEKKHFWNGGVRTSENIFLQKNYENLQKMIKTNFFFSTLEINQRTVTV